MKYQRYLIGTLLGSLILTIGLLTALNTRLLNTINEESDSIQLKFMRQIVESNLREAEKSALERAEIIASMRIVRELFALRDRDRLAEHMKELFEVQRDKFGVSQAQFHLPPAISFLRLHEPEKFGDDLSVNRHIVVDVNSDNVAREGLSIDDVGPAIFGVVPVKDLQGNPVGSFEMGADYEALLSDIKTDYGMDSALLVDESTLRKFAPGLGGKIYADINRVGHFVKFNATNWELIHSLVGESELANPKIDEKPYFRQAQGRQFGIVTLTIRDSSGNAIGLIVSAKDIQESKTVLNDSIVSLSTYGAFALVILCSLVILMIRGTIDRPLATLNHRFQALLEAPIPEPIESQKGFYGEIGTLSKNYENLRQKLAEIKSEDRP